VTETPAIGSIPEALAALGEPAGAPDRRPVLRGRPGLLLTLATLSESGAASWHGIWVDATGARPLGSPPATSLLAESTHVAGPTAALVDLVQAAARSYVTRLETLGTVLDELEARLDPGPIAELAALQRALAGTRKHVVRLAVVENELEGPLGTRFPGLDAALGQIRSELAHLESLSTGLSQAARDLVGIRNAIESNRLAESANRLGQVSNQIASLANTSNLRMLGVAYLALLLGLISAVVLIPNTAATILGMPSAAWVPGLWVDVILVVLAVIPIAVVFSRGWVKRILKGMGTYEARSAEGLSDLPELSPTADPSTDGERLIRRAP